MTSARTNGGSPRRATIEDVAAAAGVSVATVSRALRGLPNVAESTRLRVTEAASALSYQPDPAAARLAAGRTGTVTVAVPSLNGWYFSTVVASAEAVCADAGLDFQVIGVGNPQQLDQLLDESRRLERRTDGLVLVDIRISRDQAASLERRRIGLATIGYRLDGHPSVAIDDVSVGRIAAEHLASLGHRRFGVIGALTDGPLSDVPLARRSGFAAALSTAGLPLSPGLVTDGHFSVAGGHEAMSTLLATASRPTAVFALSDEMAFGALMALGEHGLKPGTDMSIMGVDDHEFSQVVGLTTIRQPVADLGSVAARLLIEAMRHADTSRSASELPPLGECTMTPDVELVVRSTTGPPPLSSSLGIDSEVVS